MAIKVVSNTFAHLSANRNGRLTIRNILTIAVCEVELSWIWREIHCRWHTCRVKKEACVEHL
jgi:hypothetical protein